MLTQSTNSSPTRIYPNTNMLTWIPFFVKIWITNCKSWLWMRKLKYLNTQISDHFSTWYLTSNKGQFPSYFWITTPSWVIRWSLLSSNSFLPFILFSLSYWKIYNLPWGNQSTYVTHKKLPVTRELWAK